MKKFNLIVVLLVIALSVFLVNCGASDEVMRVAPPPDGVDTYLTFHASGTVDMAAEGYMPLEPTAHYLDVLGFSEAELADYEAEMQGFFMERFGIDVVTQSESGQILLNYYLADPALAYEANYISDEGVFSPGWYVDDTGWQVVVLDPAGLTLGGEYEGTHVPAGTMFAFGDYTIFPEREGEDADPMRIHFKTSSPIYPSPVGYFTYLCDLESEEFGTGQAYGVGLIQQENGKTSFYGNEMLMFPGGPHPLDMYKSLSEMMGN